MVWVVHSFFLQFGFGNFQSNFLRSSFVLIEFFLQWASTTKKSSWYESSVLVIRVLKRVASARARSEESFMGVRFFSAFSVAVYAGAWLQSSCSGNPL